jgi:hypothetical protein
LTTIDENLDAIRYTAERASEPSEAHLRIEPAWPLEPPKGKRLRLDKSTTVVSAAVPPELRLRAVIAAEVIGTTVSELLREALKEKLDRTVEERTELAVQRLAWNAASDDDYRDVLIALAAEHGGMYREAVDAIYGVELRTLGRWQAFACRIVDLHQLQLLEAESRRAEG